MSEHGDFDHDDEESFVRPSRERRNSPHEDSGSRSPHRCKFIKYQYLFLLFLLKIASSVGQKKSGSKDLSTIGKKVAEKSGGLFSPEDWMCKRLLINYYYIKKK
jgi:hypothetical protein